MSGFRLRADLVSQPGALQDPVFDRRIDLGPSTGALAAALDGRPLDAVFAGLAAHGPRDKLERALRRFMLLGMIDGVSDDMVAQMRAIRDGSARLHHSVLAGAQFGCQGSGACCQGHRLGPLADEDVARLVNLGQAGAVVELPRDDGTTGRYLAQVDGRCTFLLSDHRCDLHARFGATAKPGFCQLYPLEQIATLDGLKLYDKGSCATLGVSARAGLPLVAQQPSVQPLLPFPPKLHHPVVRFDERTVFDYGHFLAFTRAGIDLVERRLASPGATLAALHQLLLELAGALASFPLEDGEPERSRDAVLTADPARLFVEESDENLGARMEGVEMLSVVAADLEEHAQGDLVRAAYGDRLAADMAAVMSEVRRAAVHLSEPSASPRAFAPLVQPEVDEVLRLSLRQQLFGPRSLVAERPIAGLLRMAVLLAAAVWGGRKGARGPVGAADLGLGHSLAARLLDLGSSQTILIQHEDLTASVLGGLAIVLR